jgi:hypothetical protein
MMTLTKIEVAVIIPSFGCVSILNLTQSNPFALASTGRRSGEVNGIQRSDSMIIQIMRCQEGEDLPNESKI